MSSLSTWPGSGAYPQCDLNGGPHAYPFSSDGLYGPRPPMSNGGGRILIKKKPAKGGLLKSLLEVTVLGCFILATSKTEASDARAHQPDSSWERNFWCSANF